MKKIALLSAFLLGFAGLACVAAENKEKITLRLGMFPNVTHAQALVAYQMSLDGKGWFESRLGDDVKIDWYSFNAGPSAMQSIFANALDMTYVGPNPAINAYIKSGGADIRIVAGSADGGSALLVNPKLGIEKPEDFKGKKIATPQYANTQDVACRAWVIANKMTVNGGSGGDVSIVPTQNPDQLALFSKGDIDACWTVEPWISRLENVGAKIFLNDQDAVTTILVSSSRFMKRNPELVAKMQKAHIELTEWINANPEEAKAYVLKGILSITKSKLEPELINSAWQKITFTSKINRKGIEAFIDQSISCGFIKKRVDTAALFPNLEK